MGEWGFLIGRVLFTLPVAVTLVVGIALLISRRDRLSSRARNLGLAGCAALMVVVLADAVYSIVIISLFTNYSSGSLTSISVLYTLVSVAFNCVGLGLLLAAVLAGARPAEAPSPVPGPAGPTPPSPYTPPPPTVDFR